MHVLAVLVGFATGCRFGFDNEVRRDAAAPTDGDTTIDDTASTQDASLDSSSGFDAPGFTCPGSYASISGSTSKYRFISTSEIWTAAEAACEADGWHLAIPDDLQELQLLANGSQGNNLWIGVTDRKTVGAWKAVSGSTQTYFLWEATEPDASALECVQVIPAAQMADQDCGSGRRAFCECDGLAADTSSY